MKESKSIVPEVALPCPRGSRWENPGEGAGYYQHLINIDTSHGEEQDCSITGLEQAGCEHSQTEYLGPALTSMWIWSKAISQSILKNVWIHVRIVVKMINILFSSVRKPEL